ncbi:TIGR02444 family protein [Halopseudomonas sp.]|uniref:TIGR02444 family protein n=1 Tax=Halopseudomonas sp. TaxID=2901191 RepID=UPI003001CC6A
MNEVNPDLRSWALDCYARPGIAPALLALQDECAQDVLLLLTVTWLWSQGRAVPGQKLAWLVGLHSPWQHQVIDPVRVVRRRLKQDPAAQALYQQAKRLELEAELLQMARLQDWALAVAEAGGGELREHLLALSSVQQPSCGERLENLLERYAAAAEAAAQIGFSSPAG